MQSNIHATALPPRFMMVTEYAITCIGPVCPLNTQRPKWYQPSIKVSVTWQTSWPPNSQSNTALLGLATFLSPTPLITEKRDHIIEMRYKVIVCCVHSPSCMHFFPLGCARRWCPSRTLLSQRPPLRCKNGVSCGSSSMWSVPALYYSASHSYQNKTLSSKCEIGSNIAKISKGIGWKTAFAKKKLRPSLFHLHPPKEVWWNRLFKYVFLPCT